MNKIDIFDSIEYCSGCFYAIPGTCCVLCGFCPSLSTITPKCDYEFKNNNKVSKEQVEKYWRILNECR